MTNLVCPNCNGEFIWYWIVFSTGCYGCNQCGCTWGGEKEGKDFSQAWSELNSLSLFGSEQEKEHAYTIAFDHLEAIAKALKDNSAFKRDRSAVYSTTKVPNDSRWWIENRDDIENKLLAIKAPQKVIEIIRGKNDD
jgi:hypothetical protein